MTGRVVGTAASVPSMDLVSFMEGFNIFSLCFNKLNFVIHSMTKYLCSIF